MNRQLLHNPFQKFYQNLLVILTLIFLTSCGSSGSSDPDNTGSTGDYTPKITVTQESVAEGDDVEFVISVSSTNTSENSISGILHLTFTGSAAGDFNSTTVLTITNGGISTTATLVPNNDTSETTKQFTVSIDNISVSNITTIALTIPDDSEVETTETLTITVDNIRINDIDYSNDTTSVSVKITDNDKYVIGITGTTDGGEPNITGSFTISVTPVNITGSSITGIIAYSGSATGTDYKNAPTSFSIPQGATSTIITINVIDDGIVDGAKTLIATISGTTVSDYASTISTTTGSITLSDDDIYRISIAGTANGGEPDTTGSFTISVSPANATGEAITGTIAYSGSAISTDYKNAPTSFSIPQGATSTIITINVIDDGIVELPETLVATISNINASGYATTNTNTTASIILSDDDSYQISIASKQDGREDNPNRTVEFTISIFPANQSGSTITVNIDFDGTATATDFTSTPPTAFFIPNNANEITISLPVHNDTDAEGTESVIAQISDVNINDSYSYTLITTSAEAAITDDDVMTISITPATSSITESDLTNVALFVIEVTNPGGSLLTDNALGIISGTIAYSDAAVDGGDITSPSADSFTFSTGSVTNNPQTITFTVNQDTLPEQAETIMAQITASIAGVSSNQYSVDTQPVSVTLNDDDDNYTLSIAKTIDGVEGSTNPVFIITSSPMVDENDTLTVTLSYTGIGITGTDFNSSPTSIIIAGGKSTATTALQLADDDLVELEETLIGTIASAINSQGVLATIATSSGTATVSDNDTYELSIKKNQDGKEGGANAEFTISISPINQSGSTIEGLITFSGTTTTDDFIDALPTEFSIADGQSETTFSLTVEDDELVESTETLIAIISSINSGDYSNDISTATASIDIVDNDTYTLSITANQDQVEEGGQATFTISVSPVNQSGSNITVLIDFGGTATATDFNSLPTEFAIADGQSEITFSLTAREDGLVENTETLIATISSINSGDYSNDISTATANVDIVGNDTYTLSITANQDQVEEDGHAIFTISVSSANQSGSIITGTISFDGSTASQEDFNTTFPTTFSIADGQNSTVVTLSVPDDDDIEKTKELIATISDINSGAYRNDIDIASATVYIEDDDYYTLSIIATKQHILEGDNSSSTEFIVSIEPKNGSGSTITGFINFTGTTTANDFINDPLLPTEFFIATGASTITIINLTVRDDDFIESTETLTATIQGINDYKYFLSTPSVTVNVEDDDFYTLSITPNQGGSEDGIDAEFTVSISPPNQLDEAIMGIIAINGESEENSGGAKGIANEVDFSDFTTTFPIVGGATTATISLAVVDDEWVESTETLTITLKGLENYKSELSTDTVSVDIEDNDIYTLSIMKKQDGVEKDVAAQFTIDVSSLNISGGEITGALTFAGSATGDFASLPTTFSIANGQDSTVVSLPVPDDFDIEKTKELIATISDINSGGYRNDIGIASATLNIEDNDAYTLIIAKTQDGSENDVNAEFTITVSPANQSGSAITGSIAFEGTATEDDFTNLTNDLFPTEFSIANGENKEVISLQVKDDKLIEPEIERLTATISNIDSSGYKNEILEESASVDITDNDRPIINFSSSHPKLLDIKWNGADNATSYILSENEDGSSGFGEIATTFNPNTTYSTAVSLIGPNRVTTDTQYMVEATLSGESENFSGGAKNLTQSDITKLIGDFKSANTTGFGWSTALSGDGATMIVSDVGTFGSTKTGFVYIYNLDGNNIWNQTAHLQASNAGPSDQFGYSVALNNEGTILAIGAPYEDSTATVINGDQNDNSTNIGAVYIFTLENSSWTETAYIKANNSDEEDLFGWSVALSDNGGTLAVGAIGEDSDTTGTNGQKNDDAANYSGAAYLFTLENSSWTQTAYIKASNTGKGDWFGNSIALSGDGRTLAVSASSEDSDAKNINGDQGNDDASGSGAVYLFTLESGWTQTAYIKAHNADKGDNFGQGVALSDDGTTLAVGAIGEGSNSTGIDNDGENNLETDSGAAYLFTLEESSWTQTAYIKASNTDNGDFFGASTALSGDGTILVVGAFDEKSNSTGINNDETNNVTNSGATYLFTQNNGEWVQTFYIKAKNIVSSGWFGRNVSLNNDGTILAVGAPRYSGGVVFLY